MCSGMLDVCRDCFAFLHACSRGKLQTLITSHKWKRSKARTRREGSGRPQSPKMMQAVIWFALLVTLIGESSPDSSEVHLPPGFRKDYFKEYKADYFDKETIERSTFYEMWREHYPHVKVRSEYA